VITVLLLLAQGIPITNVPAPGIHWNGEISFGTVLTIMALLISVFGGWYAMKGRIDLLTQAIQHVSDDLMGHERRIRELEIGEWNGQDRRGRQPQSRWQERSHPGSTGE
jgi:hypothetical protein